MLREFMRNIFTSRDNATYSMSKLIGFFGACAMVIQFIRAGSVDFQGLGIGLASLIAAFAAKAFTDTK